MAKQGAGLTVNILGKEFQVTCPAGTEDALLDAAQYLDQKMQTIRQGGRVIGVERIAIMAALNIAHEHLKHKQEHSIHSTMMDDKLQHLQNRINTVLMTRELPELESLRDSPS